MNKKIGLICLTLALAFGALGIGYATWTDTLHINGTVETGTVEWEWTGTGSFDPGPPPDVVRDYHCNDGFVPDPTKGDFWQGDKDVGYAICTVSSDKKTVTVDMHNIYPSYFNAISVYAKNTGSVPLIFEKVIISSEYDSATLDWYAQEYDPVLLDCTGEGVPDMEIRWGNHIEAQLHPEEATGEMSFWFHLFQAAPQGATNLSFTLELEAVQYNESMHNP